MLDVKAGAHWEAAAGSAGPSSHSFPFHKSSSQFRILLLGTEALWKSLIVQKPLSPDYNLATEVLIKSSSSSLSLFSIIALSAITLEFLI